MALYDSDFYAWARQQTKALRRLADSHVNVPAPVDWDHLIEEVDELAKARLRELRSRYTILVTHLLKWQFQQEQRSKSWRVTIVEQRNQIEDLLDENPSLKRLRRAALDKAWPPARRLALAETDFADDVFPATLPYRLDDLESFEFWPEPPS